MDEHTQAPEMPTLGVLGPESWQSLTDVTLRPDGMLLYQLGGAASTRDDGSWRRDARNRTALEAFTALKLDALANAVVARQQAHHRKRPLAATWDLPGGRELRSYLMTFGPLRVGYGSRFPVRNPQAERSEARAVRAELELSLWRAGEHPEPVVPTLWPPRRWMVSFEGWAQGKHFVTPGVSVAPPDDDEEPLARLLTLQSELARAVRLADALARAEHWQATGARDTVRDIFLEALRGPTIVLDGSQNWARIIRGAPPGLHRASIDEDGAVPDEVRWEGDVDHPRPPRPWPVDWLLAGRIVLADAIGRHVQWAQLFVEVDRSGRMRTRWLTRSLEDVMFLQLMEHVQRQPRIRLAALPYWPMPLCAYCGGVVLGNQRRPDTRFGTRWHAGPCRKAGQMTEARSSAVPQTS